MDIEGHHQLAPTIADLPFPPRAALHQLHDDGWRAVQIGTTQPGLRPRELSGSARRDLVVTLRRLELQLAGIDAWIPPEHLASPAHCDRAVGALMDAIQLAADLGGNRILSVALPAPAADPQSVVTSLADRAERLGVTLADHSVPRAARSHAALAVGIDPAALLAAGEDPAAAVTAPGVRIASARLVDLLMSGLRGPLGAAGGRLDVTAYRVALSIAARDVPLVVDVRQWPDPLVGIEQTRAVWREGRGNGAS